MRYNFSEDGKLYSYPTPQTARTPNEMDNGEETVWLDAGISISLEVDGKQYSFKKPQTARSPNRMENGEEMVLLDLSNQQLLEVDAVDTENNVVSGTEENNIVVTSVQQNSSQRLQRKAGIPISLDDLQQHFGMKLKDVAQSLGGKLTYLGKHIPSYILGKCHILLVVVNNVFFLSEFGFFCCN